MTGQGADNGDSRDARATSAGYIAAAASRPQAPELTEKEKENIRRAERHEVEMNARRQAHRFRQVAFFVIYLMALIPIILLAALGGSVFFGDFRVFVDFVNNGVGPWPIGAFVAGVFASFIAVFGFLAKGVFSHSRRKDDEEESLESVARAGRSVAQNAADKGG